jgi:POT family proton-dependent oligopeptide transporter
MASGHFLMAFDLSFLLALACLVAGVGCFKGNIASQVGALYATGDLRRADAFQIYFLFINAGVIAAPLTAGTLGEVYGWHYGFAAAGVGMLISLVIYRLGRKWLPADGVSERAAAAAARKPRLTREERTAVMLLLALLPVLAVGAIGNQQIFNAYLLWAPDHIDLVFFGRNMPTSWLITVDAVLSVSMLVAVLGFWRLWARRFTEPDEIAKIVIGEFISVGGMLMLAAAAYLSAGGVKAAVGWALAFHVINSIGFANVFPVGLALYARAAPKALAATMLGFYYVHLFLANNLVGWLGGLIERMPGTQFWLLHAALIAGAGAVLLLARQLFGHVLAPTSEP